MDSTTLLTFMGVVAAIVALPGPDMLLIGSSTLQAGRKAGLCALLGVLTGIVGHLTMALFGLTAVILASPALFMAIKYGGIVYILYIACQVLRSETPPLFDRSKKRKKLWRYWRSGTLVNLLNPKAALFFLSLFPQFIHLQAGSAALQIIVLGAITLVICGVMYSVFILAVSAAGTRWMDHPHALQMQRYGTATLLFCASLYLIIN